MKHRLLLSVVILLLVLLCFTGCGGDQGEEDGKPIVYASFYPIYDLVRQVSGDTLNVKTFMPMNADPHLWEPTPRDMARLANADMLIVNGANMERWLDQVRGALPDLPVLVLSDSLELITYKGASAMGDFQYMAAFHGNTKDRYIIDFGHTHEDIMRVCFMRKGKDETLESLVKRGKKYMEEKGKLIAQKETIEVEEGQVYALEMGHESGDIYYQVPEEGEWVFISDRISENILPYNLLGADGEKMDLDEMLTTSTSGFDKITYDPHSWLSLGNAKIYLNSIHDVLVKNYGYKRYYNKNKVKAIDTLTDLELEYRQKFKDIPLREFVVTHYAYQYLANEFDLIQFPLQGLVSTQTPSLKTIKKALDFCEYKGIHTIFYETGMAPKGADTLAGELGGTTVPLNSMEYIKPGDHEEPGGYTRIMRENLEHLYESFIR
ncbi:MAG: zinc ABC transporter substrate-binding protein [Tissierellia bacterium]|nr:zinc ABC transporter substrate-binding protein [Tissierellia bacterium]